MTAVTVPENNSLGVIAGRICDTENHSLPGATIIVEGENIGVTSDINGYYTMPSLKPGTYTIKVTYVGYAPVRKTITIGNGKAATANVVLTEGMELDEVKVKGAFSGQRRAMQMQKSSMGVTNVVSADQVGKFPDSNIGDALKRINGINVQYDQGEARFGQVRGTSADLTSVTVNGNRLPSAEGDTRNVQLDLIPADMVQTIEVSKVVTADMDGDAIGGSINLVTKNTPYRRVLNFTGSTGYTWISGKPQWNIGGTWGDRFFNNKLGIMASASYQYAPGGSDNTEFEYAEKKGEIQLKEAQVRQYYVTRERQSYSLALDYQFNPLHKISFKGIYNRRNDWENRYRISYKKLNSDAGDQSVVIQTKAGSDDNKSARLERQQTMDFTLDGEHTFGNLKMDWASSYSRATEDRPNERYIGLKLKGSDSLNFGDSFQDVGDEQPYSTLAIPSFSEGKWKIDEFTNSDQSIKENEIKERINFTLPLSKGLYGNTLKFGYKYTRKDKERNTEYYDYSDAADKYIPDWKDNLVSEVREGFMPGSQYPTGTQFVSKDYMGTIVFDKADGVELYEEEAGNYEATEQIHAGYIRLDQKLGKKLDATLGLRIENTRLNTSGVNYTMDEDENENESLKPTGEFKNDYTNLLPSLLLKYKMNEDGSVRASITKTLSRPKYSALIANKSFNLADQEATIGDPNIKPTTSWNIDLSIDHYFKSIGMVSLGLFYKDVKNVNVETLGYYTGTELGLAGNDETFEVTQNMNAYDARVYGVEAAYQRDFGFISPALRCLGFYGNYTYTKSTTRNYNPRLGIEDSDDVKMAGSPEHTANASLYYENKGWNIRLSYNFASSFVDMMNTGSRELDRYYDKVNYLDINASYTWGKKTKITIFAEANNLLNQPLRYYQGNKERTMQVEYYGVKVNTGVKINL
ncbi:MAG: TonB-dependent receptor [Bacteroidales bacterium]|nr:TonB-dependent receptor [Bacteroidales bacterium]